jgi:hypothetical protein
VIDPLSFKVKVMMRETARKKGMGERKKREAQGEARAASTQADTHSKALNLL